MRPLGRVGWALAGGAVLLLLFIATWVDARLAAGWAAAGLGEGRALVARAGLTDLALFTEARYTRHPSQADLHAAFQDHPLALEHFPSGSVIPPPSALLESYGRLAP